MMKLNDIYKNLEKSLNLKKEKRFLEVEVLEEDNNIDSLSSRLDNEIIMKKEKDSLIQKEEKIEINDIKQENNKKINLKKILKKQGSISSKILNFSSSIKSYTEKKLPKNKVLRISSYIIIIFSFILIDKIIIENLVVSGINNLYKASYSSNIEKIDINLSRAKTKFNVANILLFPFKIIPEQNIINTKNAINALDDTTKILLESIEIYKEYEKIIKNKEISDIYFTNILNNIKPFFIKSEKKLSTIYKYLENIKLKKEDPNNNRLETVKNILNETLIDLKYINSDYDSLLSIIGKGERKKYLIVFQNNDEIRPTGGFMGSAGIIEVFEGNIKDFKKRDIYAYEWDVNKNYTERVQAPNGINLLSSRLGLRDSNAFINFEDSAKSINYFMKKGGYDLDGVIFINQKIIIDILKELSPIEFGKYDTQITDKNFSEVISILVEAKISKKSTLDTPKQVLFDFSNLLKEKIINEKKYLIILKHILKNIESRDIAIISFNKNENELLRKLNLTGSFDYENFTDFNYPFFISVGGNKSDRYIKRTYNKYTSIKENKNNSLCSLNTNIKIDIKNNFNLEDKNRIVSLMKKFRIKENIDLINISGAGDNKSYTKVIVPKNAVIDENKIKNNGYKVFNHKGYKTVEKLLTTKSGEESFFEFNYIIKDLDCNKQNLKIYKQAGIYDYDLNLNLDNKGNKKQIKVNGLNKDFYYNL